MIRLDTAQPEAGSQSPPGNSKHPRPRARPLKQAKKRTHEHETSPSLQPQNVGQIQSAVSEATATGTVESAHPSPLVQGGESEDSGEDTPQLLCKRPNPTSCESNKVGKRQKISEPAQTHVAEASNRSADVVAAAKSKYIDSAYEGSLMRCTSIWR